MVLTYNRLQPPQRRIKREVQLLLSETLIAEIEAQDESEVHGKRTLSVVLSEAKRIAEQFVDALRSATIRVNEAVASTQVYCRQTTITPSRIGTHSPRKKLERQQGTGFPTQEALLVTTPILSTYAHEQERIIVSQKLPYIFIYIYIA